MGVDPSCPRCGRSKPRARCAVCGYRSAVAGAPTPVSGDTRPPRPTTSPRVSGTAPPPPPQSTAGPSVTQPPTGDPRRSVRPAAPQAPPRRRPPVDGEVVFIGDRRTVTRSTAAADSLSQLGEGLAGALPRATALALGVFFAPLRVLTGLSLIGAVGNRPSGARKPLEIQSFRIRPDSGGAVDCLLRGENRSGELALGDRVRVHGQRGIRGGRAIYVTKVQNLDTGTTIRPHVPFAVKYALPLAILKLCTGALILLMLLAMCGIIK